MPQLCSECARNARGVRRARGGRKMYGRHARAGASGWPDGRFLGAGRGCAGMRAREGWGAQGARGMWRCRVRGWACGGGRERLRARARGARGSRLKFCLVRQTSTGALARGCRVRGCARAGHVGAQGERGRACAGASGWPDGRSLDVRRAGLHNSFAVLLAASKGLRTAETTQMRLSSEQTVKGFSILFCSRRALSLQ